MVCYTWRLVARVFLKVNKRGDTRRRRGELSVSLQGSLHLMRLQEEPEEEAEGGGSSSSYEDEER